MKKNLNKELGSYLNKKDDDERFKELLDYAQEKAEKGEKDNGVIVIKEEGNFHHYINKTIDKIKGKKDVEIEDIDEEEMEEINEEKEGFFENMINKIKSFFSSELEENEENIEEVIEVKREDFVDVVLFTKSLIGKLPKRKANELKEDKEFIKFRDILKKYNIIK